MGLFNESLQKRIYVDGVPVDVAENTTPTKLVSKVGKDPNTTSLVVAGNNGTVKHLPKGRGIQVRDGQRFETSITGIGG